MKNQPCDLFADTKDSANSLYLKDASISLSGSSTIEIDCEFSETYPQASCVLVYREYDSTLLTVVDIPQLFEFPVSITVDSPENYTFALFGKDGALMDEKPLVCVKFNDSGKEQKVLFFLISELFGTHSQESKQERKQMTRQMRNRKQREGKRKMAFFKLKLLPQQLVGICYSIS